MSGPGGEREVLERIERRRRRPATLRDTHVNMSHGAGGKATDALVRALFLEELGNEALAELGDSALLGCAATGLDEPGSSLAFTTDSFVVRPLFFPGGDIGELAVNGTVNDLAVAGAEPLALSASFVIEEGFAVEELRRVAASMGAAARRAGVGVVAGDTKVVERGKAEGLYLATSGVGRVAGEADRSAPETMRPGDVVLTSGTIGDHGMAVLTARGDLELEADLRSDTAPLHELARALRDLGGVRCMRDATRGGLATTCNEFAVAAELAIELDEASLPLTPAVTAACELLGIDPLYVANEGKLVAVVAPEVSERAIEAMRANPLGRKAEAIGTVREDPAGTVVLETSFGGTRVVDTLVGDPLPRIC